MAQEIAFDPRDRQQMLGLTQNEANGLMLALHKAGIHTQKHLEP